jgi:hypothetical protein
MYRTILIRLDGGFLALAGAVQLVLELLAYFAGRGPYGAILEDSPYAIPWVEAHGLALLVGALFLLVAAQDRRPFWHGFAIAVHVLLGTANLVFWDSFTTLDLVPVGVLTTVAHALFVGAHAVSLRTALKVQALTTA